MLTEKDIEKFYQDYKKLGLKKPVATIAKATGYGSPNVSEWLSRKKVPSEAFINAFYREFCKPSTPEQESPKTFISYDANAHPDLMQAILSLTKSNEGLVNQHNEIVQANKAIAETNRLLAERVSGNASEEIPLAVESRFSDLLELIAELGTGTRWKNKREALLELSRLWHGRKKVSAKADIRDGSDK